MTSTLSQVYGENPIHLHHIIPLDFDSVRTVPDSHVWPKSDEISSDHRLTIPTIDLKDPNAVKLVGQACETWGAFQVINHGIPLNVVEEVETETRRLFFLPVETKMKALREPESVTGYGLPRISKFFSKYMWTEGFTIMGSPADHARRLWPNDSARFCDVMDIYQKKMEAAAEKLTNLILSSLDITGEDLHRDAGSPFGAALQLNSYPPCPNPTQAMGIAPHTDTSLLTILHQTAGSGLQIFKQEAGWVPVFPIAGALVVNVGDLLHILSNARFPSALHRAVLDRDGCHRLSVAYFYGLPSDSSVSPLLKLISLGEKPRYRSVTMKEYVGIKSKNFNEALSLIRI